MALSALRGVGFSWQEFALVVGLILFLKTRPKVAKARKADNGTVVVLRLQRSC